MLYVISSPDNELVPGVCKHLINAGFQVGDMYAKPLRPMAPEGEDDRLSALEHAEVCVVILPAGSAMFYAGAAMARGKPVFVLMPPPTALGPELSVLDVTGCAATVPELIAMIQEHPYQSQQFGAYPRASGTEGGQGAEAE